MKVIADLKRALGSRIAEKRNGVHVSRPVLNAQEWFDWGKKWGVPGLVAAADMHVTVIASSVDVKMKPDCCPVVIDVCEAVFCLMGPDNEALTVAFDSWMLWERNWAYQRNGALPSWPTYRPHMTLTYANGDFELPDEALKDAPDYIVLGEETPADLKAPEPTPDETDPEGVEAEDGMDMMVVVIGVEMSAAKALLESDTAELDPIDRFALRDIAAGHSITRGVAKRIAAEDWATDALKTLGDGEQKPKKMPPTPASTAKSREVTVAITDLPEEVRKSLGTAARTVRKFDDDERIIYGFASVSTVDGEPVEDHHGAKITTKCLREFTHDIIRGQRAGKFDHEGEVCNEIVEALVFSDDIQKSMGINLGYEPLIVGMHVPNDKDWQTVCDGEWMLSIAGTLYYTEEGDQ